MNPVLVSGNTYSVCVDSNTNQIIIDNSRMGPAGPAGPAGAGVPTDGLSGQVLLSGGGANAYWSNADVLSVNLSNYVTSTDLSGNLTHYATTGSVTANADAAYTNAVSYVDTRHYVNTNQLTTNLANYGTTGSVTANADAAYANAVTYVNSQPFVNTTQLSTNLANYATTGSVTANAAQAYSDAISYSASYVDGKSYVNTAQLSGNLANYQTTADLASNVSHLTANLATYIVANDGIVSNSAGVFVKAGNNIVVNSSGVHSTGGGGGATTLAGLSDVNITTTPTAGQVLKYDGTKWAPGTDSTTGGAGTDADTLDGQHASYYLDYNNFTNTPNLAVYATTTSVTANADAAYTNAVSYVDGKAYVNTSQLSSNIANYQTTAGLASNVAKLAANSATYVLANSGIVSNSSGVFVNGNTGLVVNSAGVFVNSTFVSSIQVANALNANLSSYIVANNGLISNSSGTFVNGNTGLVVNAAGVFVNTSYVATVVDPVFTNNVTVSNTLTVVKISALGSIEEKFNTYANANGVFTFDCSNSTIFYINTPAANFTPSLSNVVLGNNYVTAISFHINQGVTPYTMTSNVQVNSTTNTTIRWQGGLVPTGTANAKDVITLSIFNVSGTYNVLGQLTTFS